MSDQLRYSNACSIVFYLVILILSFVLVGEGHPVVNGTSCRENEFPYIVSLRDRHNRHFCGGGIIGENYIISAYHCISGDHLKKIRVVAGTHSQTKADPKYTFGIERVYHFNNKKWLRANGQVRNDNHDLVILKLNRKIPISIKAKIAKLPKGRLYPGTVITFAGWGNTMKEEEPDVLQKFTTVIQSPKVCERVAGSTHFFPPYETCTLSKKGQGLCDGDSGSPLIKDGVLVGVALWVADDCATGNPDFIADIYYYKSFIEKHLKSYEAIYKNQETPPSYVDVSALFKRKKQNYLRKRY